jgi:hypothetical protein
MGEAASGFFLGKTGHFPEHFLKIPKPDPGTPD